LQILLTGFRPIAAARVETKDMLNKDKNSKNTSDKKIKFRLRTKFLAGILLLEVLLMAAVILVVEHQIRDSIWEEFSKRGFSVTKNLAAINKNALRTYNYVKIEQNLDVVVEENGLLYAAVLLFDGEVAGYRGQEDIENLVLAGSLHERTLEINEPLVQYGRFGGEEFCDIAVPIFLNDQYWGTVRAGFSMVDMRLAIEETREMLVGLAVIGILFSCLLAVWLARLITGPIQDLVGSVGAIGAGEYDHPIAVRTGDEIGYLGRQFTDMRQKIRDQFQLLDRTNQQLSSTNASLQGEIIEHKKTELQLRKAKDAAEAASKAKSQFLANMSHEIRTPMNGVLGMTSLLLETEMDDRQRRFAETVMNSGNTLLDLINDILDFSKIEAGKLELQRTSFSLREIIDDVLEMLLGRAHAKDLRLNAVVDHDTPEQVVGDPGRLRQVLINLVTNAIKFTDEGEVTIAVAVEDRSAASTALRFEVRDTGVGIDPSAQRYIFESFSQLDGSTTRKHGGTGLGLTICKQLVTLMGGNIGVESTPGEGCTFWFCIQMDECSEEFSHRSESTVSPATPRILVVDPDAINRESLGRQLLSWKTRCSSAESGGEALSLMRAAAAEGDGYKVVILAKDLPDTDGIVFAEAIRIEPEFRPVRTVLLADLNQEVDQEILRGGAVAACLWKPVRNSKLYDCLAELRLVPNQSFPSRKPESSSPSRSSDKLQAHVLLVEDNLVNQEVAMLMLNSFGCRVDVASNGVEAVMASTSFQYDVIFMDCQMPELDGYQATAEIRRKERKRNASRRVPVIALTAHALEGDRETCLSAGMDDYLPKPFHDYELRAVLEHWLSVDRTSDRSVELSTQPA
jgi:signal transduction histidine kinase/CheY-like chemotaxis protein